MGVFNYKILLGMVKIQPLSHSHKKYSKNYTIDTFKPDLQFTDLEI